MRAAQNITFVLLSLIFLIGCSSPSSTVNSLPKQGELCFKTGQGDREGYVHIHFKDQDIEGEIYVFEEVSGQVYYRFKGKISGDTLLTIEIALEDEGAVAMEWDYDSRNGELRGELSPVDREQVCMAIVDCTVMPDTSKYDSVEEIAADRKGEYWENAAECYYSVSTDAMKRTTQHEWLQVVIEGDKVNGRGAGVNEGEQDHAFGFTGQLLNDSVIQVEVTYFKEREEPLKVSERWAIDKKTNRMRLWGHDRPESGRAYAAIPCSDIPVPYMKLMYKLVP
jgi:major membrane immunogen (membrane-anchored lipoprotein)